MRLRNIFAIAFATLIGIAGAANAQSKQITVTSNGFVPNGAVAGLAQMGHFGGQAGGNGLNVFAEAGASRFSDGSGFKSRSAYGNASADFGNVLTNATAPFGTAGSGASGTNIGAWSSVGKTTGSDGKSQWLSSGANAETGGAWSSVSGGWGGALSVGAGPNVQVNSNYQSGPVTIGGGKG